MDIIKSVSTTYEPETESRDILNLRIAEKNKIILSMQDEIETLEYKLNIEIRNINIIENTNARLREKITHLNKVINMHDNEKIEVML